MFLLIKEEYKTSSLYKWLLKASYYNIFVWKCGMLKQNRHYFCNQHLKISKKQVKDSIHGELENTVNNSDVNCVQACNH